METGVSGCVIVVVVVVVVRVGVVRGMAAWMEGGNVSTEELVGAGDCLFPFAAIDGVVSSAGLGCAGLARAELDIAGLGSVIVD